MGMSLEEIVFLFTVSGLPWPPSRSVSASLHLYGSGARYSGAGCFSKCLKGAVSALWCISRICISAHFHVWAHTICILRGHLYSGVDPSSVGVNIHICIRAHNYVCKSVKLAFVWTFKCTYIWGRVFFILLVCSGEKWGYLYQCCT